MRRKCRKGVVFSFMSSEEVSDDMRPVYLQKLCLGGLLTSQDSFYELDHKEGRTRQRVQSCRLFHDSLNQYQHVLNQLTSLSTIWALLLQIKKSEKTLHFNTHQTSCKALIYLNWIAKSFEVTSCLHWWKLKFQTVQAFFPL